MHKRIQKFLSLKLIEKTKRRDFKHSSIYYKLTDIGVFCVLANLYQNKTLFTHDELIETINGIINNYGDNDFFYVFLYPFFDRNTIVGIVSKVIIDEFLNYCTACCERVLTNLLDVAYMCRFIVLLRWNDLVKYIQDTSLKGKKERWLLSLKNRYQTILDKDLAGCLDWLDSNTKLRLVDENTIAIEKDKNELFLRLRKSEKKAVLTYKSKTLIEYDVVPDNDDFIINQRDEQQRMKNLIMLHLTEYEMFREWDIEKTMVLPFITQGRYRDADKEYWRRLEPDIRLLINDKKFYRIVSKGISNVAKSWRTILEYKTKT